ncbi:protein translocase subunit SecF [Elusimicrobiota bacterium]
MFSFIGKTDIDFVSARYYCYGASAAFFILTAIFLAVRGGPPLSVDFKGGIAVDAKVPVEVDISNLRKTLSNNGLDAQVQTLGTAGHYMIKIARDEEEASLDDNLHKSLKEVSGSRGYEILRKDFVGSVVGEKLRRQAFFAIALSFLGIIVYVGFRFQNLVWGLAGVIALFHDVFLSLGFITLFNLEMDLVLIAALLTVGGYSINDTVVILDRLRERLRIHTKESISKAMNRAVNDTLSRTIITSGTSFIAVLALSIFGGMTLRPFTLVLLFGIVVGTYSTIGIASNIVCSWASLGHERYRR